MPWLSDCIGPAYGMKDDERLPGRTSPRTRYIAQPKHVHETSVLLSIVYERGVLDGVSEGRGPGGGGSAGRPAFSSWVLG